MNYLSIDIGTTCSKCQLFSKDGEILEYISQEYGLKVIDGENYLDIDVIWYNVKNMIADVSKHEISSICISSLGESFVLLDKQDNILTHPMLYTDSRGAEEAKNILEVIGEKRAYEICGVMPHSMYSVSKLLYIKKNKPEIFEKVNKLLLVCDYIGYLLTGQRVIDYGLASRTGVFDINSLNFSTEMLKAFDIPREIFSEPKRAGCVVGKIKDELIYELGIKGAPVLVLGSHDQICTSIGAGALLPGEAVDGMGTVECTTVLFDKNPSNLKMGRQGYPTVPYAIDGLFCTYMLNFSCGSTVSWFRKKIMHDYHEDYNSFFEYAESKMTDGPTGILTLPYFGGASTPYQDLNAKGAILNLSSESSDSDIYKSIMEGTAMEMLLNAETVYEYGIKELQAVATGGGASSEVWMQIKADIQNIPIRVLRSHEGGLCGCAMLSAVALGDAADLFEAKKNFVRYTKEFKPRKSIKEAYVKQYQKYKKLYTTLKGFN